MSTELPVDLTRYARQMALAEVGLTGQERLRRAAVLVIGAGGLGCAVLPTLCAAGVGRLVVLDPDRVEESNLHRQPLYRTGDLGRLKALAARAALQALNPDVRIDAFAEALTPANAQRHVATVDVVVDAADSLAVTYALSDECQRAGRALVSASVLGLCGYVGAFCGGVPSYRAVFPEMPRQAGSCAQSGVLGSAVGVLGMLQAHLALALLLDIQPTVLGRLISVELGTLRFGGFSFAAAGRSAVEPSDALVFIAPEQVTSSDRVVDLRSLSEAPNSPFVSALRLSVEQIERHGLPPGAEAPGNAASDSTAAQTGRLVLCCRTGLRAWRAARALQRQGYRSLALVALGQ